MTSRNDFDRAFNGAFDAIGSALQSQTLAELLPNLLPSTFIKEETGFESLDALVAASGFDTSRATRIDDFDAEPFNRFISANTRFSGFSKLLKAGLKNWVDAIAESEDKRANRLSRR